MAVKVQATYKLTGWNTNELRQRIPVILNKYGTVLDRQLKQEIQTKQFEWPLGNTRRYGRLTNAYTTRNGVSYQSLSRRAKIIAEQGGLYYSLAENPRDIVDSGKFLRSQQIHRNEDGGYSLRFTWNAPYAGLILTGYTTNKGTVVPGRNWIKPALEAIPLDRFFAEQWRKLERQGM